MALLAGIDPVIGGDIVEPVFLYGRLRHLNRYIGHETAGPEKITDTAAGHQQGETGCHGLRLHQRRDEMRTQAVAAACVLLRRFGFLDLADKGQGHRFLQKFLEGYVADFRAAFQPVVQFPRFTVGGDQTFELVLLVMLHFTVEKCGEAHVQRLLPKIVHSCHALLSVSPVTIADRRRRAVERRDMTVPIGMPRISAVSL